MPTSLADIAEGVEGAGRHTDGCPGSRVIPACCLSATVLGQRNVLNQ